VPSRVLASLGPAEPDQPEAPFSFFLTALRSRSAQAARTALCGGDKAAASTAVASITLGRSRSSERSASRGSQSQSAASKSRPRWENQPPFE